MTPKVIQPTAYLYTAWKRDHGYNVQSAGGVCDGKEWSDLPTHDTIESCQLRAPAPTPGEIKLLYSMVKSHTSV